MRNGSQGSGGFLAHRPLSRPKVTKAVDKGIENIEAYIQQNESAEGPVEDRATSFLLTIKDMIRALDGLNGTLVARDRKSITYALVSLVDKYLLEASDDDRRLRFSRLAADLGSKWRKRAKTLNEKYSFPHFETFIEKCANHDYFPVNQVEAWTKGTVARKQIALAAQLAERTAESNHTVASPPGSDIATDGIYSQLDAYTEGEAGFLRHDPLDKRLPVVCLSRGIEDIELYMRRNDVSVTAPDRAGLFLLDIKLVLHRMETTGLQYYLNVDDKRRTIYAFVRLVDMHLIRHRHYKLDRASQFRELESKIGTDNWKRIGSDLKRTHKFEEFETLVHKCSNNFYFPSAEGTTREHYDQAAFGGSRMDPGSLVSNATECSIGKTTSIPWFDNIVDESGYKRSHSGLSYDDLTRTRDGSIELKRARRDGEVFQPRSWRAQDPSSSSMAYPLYASEQSYGPSFDQYKTEVPSSWACLRASDITEEESEKKFEMLRDYQKLGLTIELNIETGQFVAHSQADRIELGHIPSDRSSTKKSSGASDGTV